MVHIPWDTLGYVRGLVIVWGSRRSIKRPNAARIAWNTAGEEYSSYETAPSGHLHWTPSILKPGFFFAAVASPPSR